MKIQKKLLLCCFFFELFPFADLKMCNHDISKSITARSFELGQLVEDDE